MSAIGAVSTSDRPVLEQAYFKADFALEAGANITTQCCAFPILATAARQASIASRLSLASWVTAPQLVADPMYLDRADIVLKGALDHGLELLRAFLADLAALGARLLGGQVLLRHGAEGVVEYRDVMLEHGPNLDLLLTGEVARCANVAGLERDRLVAVCLGQFDAAVPVAMVHIGPAEDDEAGLDLFLVGHERHDATHATIYIGMTDDLARRIWEHREKINPGFTAKYGCDKLVWYELHETRDAAFTRERQLKEWRRSWKLMLIEADNPTWRHLYETLN